MVIIAVVQLYCTDRHSRLICKIIPVPNFGTGMIIMSRFSSFPISGRIVLLPVPRIATHILQRLLGFPAKNMKRLVRIRITFRKVAGTPCAVDMVHLDTVNALEGLDDLRHTVGCAGTEVEDLDALVGEDVVDRLDVTLGEVNDMNVVACAGASLVG